MIEVAGITKSFKEVKALKDLSFRVNSGEIMGFLGPNGAGKTTTIKVICGLCKPDSGAVKILNKDALRNYTEIGPKVSVILESHGLYNFLTAWENLEFYSRLAGIKSTERKSAIQHALTAVDLLERKNSLVKTYSKGMARRLAIARALIVCPQILILDEPFDGVDAVSRQAIIKILREWNEDPQKCIIITSHNMADIEAICNKVTVIKSGRLLLTDAISNLYRNTEGAKTEVYLSQMPNPLRIKEFFKQYKSISEYSIEGTKLVVRFADNQNTSQLASFLIEKGLAFDEIKVQHESLEEMYIRWVKNDE